MATLVGFLGIKTSGGNSSSLLLVMAWNQCAACPGNKGHTCSKWSFLASLQSWIFFASGPWLSNPLTYTSIGPQEQKQSHFLSVPSHITEITFRIIWNWFSCGRTGSCIWFQFSEHISNGMMLYIFCLCWYEENSVPKLQVDPLKLAGQSWASMGNA